MPTSRFEHFADSPVAPARECFAITPNDAQDLTAVTKALYVGSGGDIVLVSARNEAAVSFRNVPSGYILDVQVRAVKATGTSATDIVGLA